MGGDLESNLEMRCSADEAWYDGSLSFARDSRDFIVVHFNDFGKEEDERFSTADLLDPKKLKARVRVRSEQLQDWQCKLVNEGQLICGCLDDGEDRRYYDAKVISIVKKEHVFSDDGEECKCDFKLLWNDGPKKGKETLVGCAEVCFLSMDNPEEDPMVKSLVKRLGGSGEQQRRKLATPKRVLTKDLPSPRPSAPSPTPLDVAQSKKQAPKEPPPPRLEHSHPQSKKQSFKDPSPRSPEPTPLKKQLSSKDHSPSTLPNHRVQLKQQQASAKFQGSKKKRIMQAKSMEQPDLASDNDALNNLDVDVRPSSTPKIRNREGSADAPSHGNESDDPERNGGAGENTKKGAVGRRRLVKAKSSKAAVVAPTPEVVPHVEEAPVKAMKKSMSFKEKVKLNTKKAATEDRAARDEATAIREEVDIPRPVKKRVKSNPKKPTSPEVAAPCDESPSVEEDDDVRRRPIKMRVKFSSSGKKANPDVAAAPKEAAAVREEDVPRSSVNEGENSSAMKKATPNVSAVRDETVSLTLGERVKLKSLEKSKSVEASPVKTSEVTQKKKKPEVSAQKKVIVSPQKKAVVAPQKKPEVTPQKKPEGSPQKKRKIAHKVSLEKVGKQVVGKQKQTQVQLGSRLRPHPDEATRPDAPSNDVAAPALEDQLKRKPGRPRKNPVPKPASRSLASKKQATVQGLSKGQRQSSQQEEIIDAVIAEKQTPDPATEKTTSKSKKRPWEEPLPAIPDADYICSDKSTQEEDDTRNEPQRITTQAHNNDDSKDRNPRGATTDRERQQPKNNDDALSNKSSDDDEEHHTPLVKKTRRLWRSSQITKSHTDNNDDDEEDHTLPFPYVDANSERLDKRTIPDLYKNIVEKFHSNPAPFRPPSVEKLPDAAHEAMTPGSSEELTGSPPSRASNQETVQETVQESGAIVSDVRKPETAAAAAVATAEGNITASGKRRRRHVVLTDDEEDEDDEDEVEAAAMAKKCKIKEHHLHAGGSVNSAANGHDDDCNDPKTTSTSALDEEVVDGEGQGRKKVKAVTSRLLLISNMETNVSAHDALQLLMEHTEGVCAVHVLPVGELQTATVGYALYRDHEFALKAFEHLAAPVRFVVSLNGRPWIISQSTDVYGPHLCGFAARTAFKSDDPGVCGIVSDQPPIQQLLVVTKERDSKAHSQALQKSKTYAEHQKWRKELYDRVVKDEIKG